MSTHQIKELLDHAGNSPDSQPKTTSAKWDSTLIPKTTEMVAKLSFRMNVNMTKERLTLLATDLIEDGWTVPDIEAAAKMIRSDIKLAEKVNFFGTIFPAHFVMARQIMTTPPSLGKCFHSRDEYDRCRNEATIRAWGEIYCDACFDRHAREAQAQGRELGPALDSEFHRISRSISDAKFLTE